VVQALGSGATITVELADGTRVPARVVGITTANASVDGTSSGSIGVGLAIPSSQARQVADRLLAQT
jgi:S1-C subfamily serine protease